MGPVTDTANESFAEFYELAIKVQIHDDFPFRLTKVLHCLYIFDAFLALFLGKHYYKVVL